MAWGEVFGIIAAGWIAINVLFVAFMMFVCKSKSGNLKMDKRGEFMYGHDEESEEPFVVRELKAKADLFLERNRLYGDNYKRFGAVFSLVMQGQNLDTSNPSDMCRLGILVQIVGKVTRYGENFNRGGHDDSLDDIAVYSLMLKELDQDASKSEEEEWAPQEVTGLGLDLSKCKYSLSEEVKRKVRVELGSYGL